MKEVDVVCVTDHYSLHVTWFDDPITLFLILGFLFKQHSAFFAEFLVTSNAFHHFALICFVTSQN